MSVRWQWCDIERAREFESAGDGLLEISVVKRNYSNQVLSERWGLQWYRLL